MAFRTSRRPNPHPRLLFLGLGGHWKGCPQAGRKSGRPPNMHTPARKTPQGEWAGKTGALSGESSSPAARLTMSPSPLPPETTWGTSSSREDYNAEKRTYPGVPWWPSGLRILKGHYCDEGSVSDLGTSACQGHGHKKKEEEEEKKKRGFHCDTMGLAASLEL